MLCKEEYLRKRQELRDLIEVRYAAQMAEEVHSFQEALSPVENSQGPRGTTLHTNQLQDRDVTPERLETSQTVWTRIPPPNLPESGYPSGPTRMDDRENL